MIPPEAALRAGSFDPLALLVAWCARKAFYCVLWLGLTIVLLTGHVDDAADRGIDTLWSDLRSPLALLWVALGMRLAAAGAGLALAYPLAREQQARYPYRSGLFGTLDVVFDRWQLMRALSSFRWTYPVRVAAVERLGPIGARLRVVGPVIGTLNVVSLIALAVAIVISS